MAVVSYVPFLMVLLEERREAVGLHHILVLWRYLEAPWCLEA